MKADFVGRNIAEINETVKKATHTFNREGLLGHLAEFIPPIKPKLKKRRTLRALGYLEQAFEIGYVPGGIQGKPDEWLSPILVRFIDLVYHPDNKAYLKEMVTLIRERRERMRNKEPGGVLHSMREGQRSKGYGVTLTTDALLDILMPRPTQNKSRKIEYGNTDKNYWKRWVEDIRRYI